MRPLHLKMTAFGPYREQETIEFSELGGHTLFVIAGPTGAGKTSIFDALSFALFGTGSGEDRQDTRILRSDFAPDDLHTAVELTFEVRGRTIRIFRQMAHVKVGNKTATGEKYELVELTEEGEIPLVERYTIREINARLMELVGMTADQFHQIVMLPQGEFRKFLTSSTDQKEVILRKLFRTERFQKMTEYLREKRQQLVDVSAQHRAVQGTLVSQAAGLFPNEPVFLQQEMNLYQIDTALQKGIDELTADHVTSKEQEDRAWELFQLEQKKLQQLEWLAAKQARLQELLKKQETLTNQQPLMEKVKVRIEAAVRAGTITHIHTTKQKTAKELSKKRTHVENLHNKLVDTTATFTKLEATYQQLKDQEPARQNLRQEIERLNERIGRLEKLEHLIRQEQQLAATVSKTQADYQKLQQTVEQKGQRIQYLLDQYQQLHAESNALPDVKAAYQSLGDQIRLVDRYNEQVIERKAIQEKLELATTGKEQAARDWQAFQAEQANQLALQLVGHLHDGKACPVCGATEHPDPARPTTSSGFGDGRVLEQKLEQAKGQALRFTLEMERLDQELKNFQENHPQLADSRQSLVQEQEQKAQQIQVLETKRQQADACVKEGKPLRQEVDELKKLLPEQEQQLAVIMQQWQQLQGHLVALKDSQNGADLEETKRLSTSKTAELNSQLLHWQQTERAYGEVRDTYQSLTQQVNWETEQLKRVETDYTQLATDWEQALAEQQFQTEDDYRQAVLPTEDVKRYRQELRDYEQQVQQVTTERQLLEEELKGYTEEESLEAQKVLVSQVKAQWETHKQMTQQLASKLQTADRLVEQFVELKDKVGDTEKKLATTTALYDALRGQNAKKLSFERYMLVAYLEQITEAANQRLESLSGGQFRLVRSDRQESHGKQSGLQLDVYDGYTGQFRDVKSLSGGEKFHASLSLALGMADVMQEMNGGIQIDTMFIDEGFGSLDEESLQKAIDALVQLQRTGRLIGVISHVKELQAAIPAKLKVHKSASGTSSTRFEIS
ncbi:SMC family ATPase [Chryseomicrobium sp. FSL W7-1435]|uniref:SMC family ATPase n=1 Tax=Chryseomicrobium sp. FSL W7-1435 TaxID=2921704 RepID=UPI00315ADCC8